MLFRRGYHPPHQYRLNKDYYAFGFGHGALAPYIGERLKPSHPKKSLIHWHCPKVWS